MRLSTDSHAEGGACPQDPPARKPAPRRRRLPETLSRAYGLARALVAELEKLKAATEADPNAWADCIGSARAVVQQLERSLPTAPSQPLPAPEQLVRFGQLLRDRRTAAGLSRVALGRKAKLSDATIKFLETAKHPASRATLIRLLGVAELGLTWEEVAFLCPTEPTPATAVSSAVPQSAPTERSLNCFVSPTYNPVALVAELGRFLKGAGGHVEQTAAYLDAQSAADYLALCRQSPLVAAQRAGLPLEEMAEGIAEHAGLGGLDVIALGAGDGQLEVRLVQVLGPTARDLCLVDVSQPLLACALQHAAEALTAQPKLPVWGLQANFHHLPLHTDLYAPAERKRRRLFVMLGNTLGSLDHELRFLRHSLLGAQPDDLLLLDFQLTAAAADQPAAIKLRDRSWRAGLSPAHERWLTGPLWRHGREVSAARIAWEIDTSGAVPGSYALSAVATVQAHGRAERRFSLFRFRRYDAEALARTLADCGWQRMAQLEHGPAGQRAALLLCRWGAAGSGISASSVSLPSPI